MNSKVKHHGLLCLRVCRNIDELDPQQMVAGNSLPAILPEGENQVYSTIRFRRYEAIRSL